MLSKDWTDIDRLLLLCHQDERDLKPVLQILANALPKTAIELSILDGDERVNFKLYQILSNNLNQLMTSPPAPLLQERGAEGGERLKRTMVNQSDSILFEVQTTGIPLIPLVQGNHLEDLIQTIKARAFAAAIILTKPDRSPYTLAYLCYLAGIPIRIGQSQEFGGGVLSTCITPSLECISPTEYYLHLIKAVGIPKPVLPSL